MCLLQTPNTFTLNAFARSKRGKYAHGIKSTKVGVTMHARYQPGRCDVTVGPGSSWDVL